MSPLKFTRHVVLLASAIVLLPAFAQSFSLESAVLDSRSSKNLGVTTEQGQMAEFFKAQKAVTFGILRSAGISLEQLPPEVRARIERYQTTNLEAFRAFSQGLDLKDQGRFAEAKELFRRASELDPGFGLAVEQQQAMPDVNVGSGIQMRAVLAIAANSAVDRGRQGYTVDLAHALAAIQAGQTIALVATPADPGQLQEYTANTPGSSDKFAQNLVVGLSYTVQTGNVGPQSVAVSAEWPSGKFVTNGGVLESLSGPGLSAARGSAEVVSGSPPDGFLLADGATRAYWGSWKSSGSNTASLTVQGNPYNAASGLGTVDYVMAQATRQMPGTGTVQFTPLPGAGSLTQVSGTIQVDFLHQNVGLQNLGFTIGNLGFSGLNGSASYASISGSGAFNGNYTSGSCSGCNNSFTPLASGFNGNFVGRNADGLVFSTIMINDNSAVSGVQLFTKH